MNYKSWPFEEARKIVKRAEQTGQTSVRFQTGYGPSGLPHIGTFGEVCRTTMVRSAFRHLTNDAIPTELICFSDDLDGMRAVPDNVPNRRMLAQHLDIPLTSVPDPFGKFESFAHHNNAKLREFLDRFGFDYEFVSATDCYRSGKFDGMLRRMLEAYEQIMAVILPTLGDERRATYAPFLPVCPRTGKVLQVPLAAVDAAAGTVAYEDPQTKDIVTVPVTGGHVKCQWKPDWAMRWQALNIDYEMAGKDLIDSVRESSAICRAMGGRPPEGFIYEMFLDADGRKISKSIGNGIAIDEWLDWAPAESLALFMFRKPRTAKRLDYRTIPQLVDEYYQHLANYQEGDADSPAWHIHAGKVPVRRLPVTFDMLLNLVSASNATTEEALWGFVLRHDPAAAGDPELEKLIGCALRYYRARILPTKEYRAPDATEREMLEQLAAVVEAMRDETDGAAIQTAVYDVGRAVPRYRDPAKPAKDGRPGVKQEFFRAVYQTLLGQSSGPRFGPFVAIYGAAGVLELIREALERQPAA